MPANSTPLLKTGRIAAADLPAYCPVKDDGSAAAAGEPIIGITEATAKAGSRVNAVVVGSAEAWAGAAITSGQSLQVGAGNTVVPAGAGNVIGTALNDAGIGDKVEVLLRKQPDSRDVRKYGTAGAGMLALRYISTSSFGDFNTTSFRQIFQTPVTGLAAVRAVYETDSTTPPAISATAFAAGRAFSDDNPLDASGSAAAWKVVTNTAVSAASATYGTDGQNGVGKTAYVYLNIPAPVDGSGGGYVYVGTKLASGTARGIVGSPTRPTEEYENYVSGLLPTQKYRALYQAGDFVNSNQNGMTGATKGSRFNPVTQLEIIPIVRAIWGVVTGDSTTYGLGLDATDPAKQPHGYSWATIACHRRVQSGIAMAITNLSFEGKPTAFFLGTPGGTGKLAALLADADFYPSFVVIQPFSGNDGTFTQATVDAALLMALQSAQACRKRGILPIIRTVTPTNAANTTQDNLRKLCNTMIRNSGEVVFDMDALVSDNATPAAIQPAYTIDGKHLSRAGNELCATAFLQLLSRYGF